jgi:hypothetical protein
MQTEKTRFLSVVFRRVATALSCSVVICIFLSFGLVFVADYSLSISSPSLLSIQQYQENRKSFFGGPGGRTMGCSRLPVDVFRCGRLLGGKAGKPKR